LFTLFFSGAACMVCKISPVVLAAPLKNTEGLRGFSYYKQGTPTELHPFISFSISFESDSLAAFAQNSFWDSRKTGAFQDHRSHLRRRFPL